MRLCCHLSAPSERSKASCSAGKATVAALWMPTVPGVGATPDMGICAQGGPAATLNLRIVTLLHFIPGDEGTRVQPWKPCWKNREPM